jgi:hypothetical protein
VAAWLAGRLAATASAEFSEPAKRSIFFVTSATSGRNPLRPARLGEIIDPERAVHDLAVPARLTTAVGDDPDEAARTARTCIETARATQPRGPYLLAGIGDGCAIAHEMARQWNRVGESVHLVLIDNRSHSAGAEAAQPPQVDAPIAGTVTLGADRESLASGVAQGWEAIFGDRLRVVPMTRHERPRRALLEVAGAVRGWLETVEGPTAVRAE